MEVRVDRRRCQGVGACVRRAPATFSLDGEHKAVVADEPGDPETTIREAVAACPFFALELRE